MKNRKVEEEKNAIKILYETSNSFIKF